MISWSSLHCAMRIIVDYQGRRKDVDVSEEATPMDVLTLMCLLPDAHLVFMGGTPVPIDERLADGMVLKVVKVASGG